MANVSIEGPKSTTSENDLLKCFVCGGLIVNRYYLLSSVRCQTSGMKAMEILSQLVGELYCIVISENDVICRCCTSLLNTYDKLECLKNQLCSIVRQNLKDNYSSKQEGLVDFEASQNLFSVKPDLTAMVTSYRPILSTQSNPLKLEENKSIIHSALESLQLDLGQVPSIDQKESTLSEQINSAPSVPHDIFTQCDIENQIKTLTDINTNYISNELSLNSVLGDFQHSLFKMDVSEEANLGLDPEIHGITSAGELRNIHVRQINNQGDTMDACLSSDEYMTEHNTAENFYVQIVRETGETSRRVLTLDSSSAQVLKHNWEEP